jgi:hypothetical protein
MIKLYRRTSLIISMIGQKNYSRQSIILLIIKKCKYIYV